VAEIGSLNPIGEQSARWHYGDNFGKSGSPIIWVVDGRPQRPPTNPRTVAPPPCRSRYGRLVTVQMGRRLSARAENPFFRCRSVPEPRCIDLRYLLADRCPLGADHVRCVLKPIETSSIGRIVSGQCRPAECICRAEDRLENRFFGRRPPGTILPKSRTRRPMESRCSRGRFRDCPVSQTEMVGSSPGWPERTDVLSVTPFAKNTGQLHIQRGWACPAGDPKG
jgi:hypothetical protein